MNGSDIPIDHGYPLRLVVPGFIGIRNAKWVEKLEISDEEAPSAMQRRDYKIIKETDWTKIEWDKHPAVNGNLSGSVICSPKTGETVQLN